MTTEKRIGLIVFAAVGGVFLLVAGVVAIIAARDGAGGSGKRYENATTSGLADRPMSTGSPKDDVDYIAGHRWWRTPPTRKRVDEMVAAFVEWPKGKSIGIDGNANLFNPLKQSGPIESGRCFSMQYDGDVRPTREQVLKLIRRELDEAEYRSGPGR
jgi:hypothetical protein